MILGRVKGNIWATRKEESLKGYKLLLVQPVEFSGEPAGRVIVAGDKLGAGEGELVLVVHGSSARMAADRRDVPIDATVVGIVDSVEVERARAALCGDEGERRQ